MNDDAFIEAIRASPADHALRLIYADWLEERGDPRNQLLRLEDVLRCGRYCSCSGKTPPACSWTRPQAHEYELVASAWPGPGG